MSLQQMFDQAVAAHNGGQLAEAEKQYRQVLAQAPKNYPVLYMLGVALMQQGRNEEALVILREALSVNPRAPEALFQQCCALLALGLNGEALKSIDKALAMETGRAELYFQRGACLIALGRLPDALESFDGALKINPDFPEALLNRANVLRDTGKPLPALEGYDRVLVLQPGFVIAHLGRANALMDLGRPADALAAADQGLAMAPNLATLIVTRADALVALERGEEALQCYAQALALTPNDARALNNRGNALISLKRPAEALTAYDKALGFSPQFADGWSNRGNALVKLERLEEGLASYDKALAINPALAEGWKNRGRVLLKLDRLDDALAAFSRATEAAFGPGREAVPLAQLAQPHRKRHDVEQQEYLRAKAPKDTDKLGARLKGAAITPGNVSAAKDWKTAKPQIAVIDNLLTPQALTALRRFCLEKPVWGLTYDSGYVGALPEHGFCSPLLGQIAEELRAAFPDILKDHPLLYMWSFKYDSELQGTSVHADEAAVNVNFWLTPDEANLDPKGGGLVVWDVSAPLDWDFDKYNSDVPAIRDFLSANKAKPVTVPYKENRAVIFDSDLFHETDKIRFKDGYENRRINVTMLFGRREKH